MIEWQDPPATDNSGDSPTVVCNPPSGTSFDIGVTRVTCIALDGYKNNDSCSFYVDIIDNKNPKLESCPANKTSYTDPGQSTALIVWQSPPATDNSGVSPTVVCNPPSGANFAIGSTYVTCTALDEYGNKDNCAYYVNIIGKTFYFFYSPDY